MARTDVSSPSAVWWASKPPCDARCTSLTRFRSGTPACRSRAALEQGGGPLAVGPAAPRPRPARPTVPPEAGRAQAGGREREREEEEEREEEGGSAGHGRRREPHLEGPGGGLEAAARRAPPSRAGQLGLARPFPVFSFGLVRGFCSPNDHGCSSRVFAEGEMHTSERCLEKAEASPRWGGSRAEAALTACLADGAVGNLFCWW
ncbi:unnamed protein product [Prorocentrum cordatum]|uniref:Uncharacterized protein n=1 Tax=Prorocentrum cordatum TaxID=2364126 RepID=A0ABN9TSF4_9DINO|nr:unnamed protein product [Polarella glacialis]